MSDIIANIFLVAMFIVCLWGLHDAVNRSESQSKYVDPGLIGIIVILLTLVVYFVGMFIEALFL